MMRCAKCDGQSVFPAMNEAPDGARDWRKCMSCGMRWDPTKDVLDTVKRAFEEWQPEEKTVLDSTLGEGETIEILLDDEVDEGDDLDALDEPVESSIDLVMKDVLVNRGRTKKEKPAMPKFVSAAHRERWIAGQKLSRKLKQEAAGGGQDSTGKRRPGRPKKVSAAVVSVPAVVNAKRSAIAVEAGPINGVRVFDRTGELMSLLDASLVSAQADVQALERTREILSRQQ